MFCACLNLSLYILTRTHVLEPVEDESRSMFNDCLSSSPSDLESSNIDVGSDPEYVDKEDLLSLGCKEDRRGRAVERERAVILRGLPTHYCRAHVKGYAAMEAFLTNAAVRNVLEPGERVTEHTHLTALRQLLGVAMKEHYRPVYSPFRWLQMSAC